MKCPECGHPVNEHRHDGWFCEGAPWCDCRLSPDDVREIAGDS